jgi:hypothetical protein
MGGAAAESRLSPVRRGGVVFSCAGAADEDEVRALLARVAMGGRYRLCFERGEDALRPLGPTLSHATMIARDEASAAAVGVYERVTRPAFVDGTPVALPYLAALRIAPSHRRRLALLRAGFDSLRPLARKDEAPFALTSIGSENQAARRLLTAGLPGLPRYEPAGALSTFALRCTGARSHEIESASQRDFDALSAFLNARNATRQFAPVWSAPQLAQLALDGLEPEHVLIARRGGAIIGSLAVWDQAARRSTVVRAYPRAIGMLRPLINLAGPVIGLPRLPREGAPLRQATLALLAVADDDDAVFLRLVDAALTQASARGLSVAALGLPTEHPWRARLLKRRRALEYRTELFRVVAQDTTLAPLDTRPPQPEIALL